MSYSNFLVAACTVASFSLSAQPSVDVILLTAPTYTESLSQLALLSSWSPPAGGDVWVLPPSGTKFLVNANMLAAKIAENSQTGVFSLYFPSAGSGLRADLIID